jgi:hypothetical protein
MSVSDSFCGVLRGHSYADGRLNRLMRGASSGSECLDARSMGSRSFTSGLGYKSHGVSSYTTDLASEIAQTSIPSVKSSSAIGVLLRKKLTFVPEHTI